jgi:radical SAM-linked protein
MSDDAMPPRQRIRLTYERSDALKFISHQDEFRIWERALRRANLPLLYKQGYNPQPHMQFAAPLGVGFTGVQELLDIILSPPCSLPEVMERLGVKLPPGLTLLDVKELPVKSEALSGLLIGADYTIVLYAEPDEIEADQLPARIAGFLGQGEIWRERIRKGQYYTYNLRPLVYELRYMGYDAQAEEHTIFLRVQQRDGATGRPDEVVSALGGDAFARTLRRQRLYFANDPVDADLFAHYPIVSQAELSPPHAPKPSGKSRFVQAEESAATHTSHGRSISERAADEFV